MPADNAQKKNVLPVRPLMPRLAASSTKTPQQAPKLAQHFPSTRTPPVLRSLPAQQAAPYTKSTPNLDSFASATAFVSPNVTPRSSSRKSRPDSTLSSPNNELEHTPTKVRPFSIASPLQDPKSPLLKEGGQFNHQKSNSDVQLDHEVGKQGTNFTMGNAHQHNASTTSPKPLYSTPSYGSSFFFASEASVSQSSPQRPALQKKPSSFLYADSALDERGPQNENDSNVDSPPDTTSPRLQQPTTQACAPTFARSTSPQKRPLTNGFGHFDNKEEATSIKDASLPRLSRRQSSDMRSRKTSLDSNGSRNTPTLFTALDQEILSNVVSNTATSSVTAGGFTSPLSNPGYPRPAVSSYDNSVPNDEFIGRVNSPTGMSPAPYGQTQYSELAANARRERKVMDLEISNSSLLAINRSLEREVRRQKAELRRFRRMSRRSYSSWLPDSPADASPAELAEVAEQSEEDNERDDGNEDDDSSEDDSSIEDSLSPTALAESDERHLRSDQKRLKLDLTKHKELLVDSQKMNQTIRRCLGVTEQLIKDGEKALQYRVLVSDIELGGRVLSPEEQEGKNLSNVVSEAGDTDDMELNNAEFSAFSPLASPSPSWRPQAFDLTGADLNPIVKSDQDNTFELVT